MYVKHYVAQYQATIPLKYARTVCFIVRLYILKRKTLAARRSSLIHFFLSEIMLRNDGNLIIYSDTEGQKLITKLLQIHFSLNKTCLSNSFAISLILFYAMVRSVIIQIR